ncbi:outer envelope protein 64, chloroplastic isoform X1 [Triticum aestivum]|uniref:outer envelope protein 64, chloroplastic isoform X1 n=1 Tax=Triticum aestivum TaxID=4565 RepID=UPI001D016094|nr:outer envelope protein 64, chloroplastic-like isoform X1 [Triticum aestivum]
MASSTAANLWVLLGLGIAGVLLAAKRLKRPARPDHGAFVSRLELLPPPQPPPPQARHPLTDLCFAIADAFHVSGYITSFGSLEWAKTHDAATQTSLVVSTLVDGGAICVGKTVIDEMAYSIHGENKHFGTPTNPAASDRVPGGCSSGSAVAVAGGMVDFALGIDSIGGVRVPGGYCGVLAFRPSHAVISNSGVIPVAPSLDTIGWFAKDPIVLRRVGHLLLKLSYTDIRLPRHFYIADDCFEISKIPARRFTQVVTKSVEKLYGRQVLSHVNLGNYLASKIPSLRNYSNGQKNGDSKFSSLQALSSAMQLLHKHEFRDQHNEWINSAKSAVDASIVGNLSDDGDSTINIVQDARKEVRLALNTLLKDDGILVIPTALGCPPKLNARELSSTSYNAETLCLQSLSSMSGCCQVTVPIGTHDKCPISVSFIARHGGDRFLLDTTQAIYATIQEQVEILAKSNPSSKEAMNEEAAEAAKEKGNSAFKEKQWQKAINLYTEAIKLNGKVATYYSNRAAAFLELAKYDLFSLCNFVSNLSLRAGMYECLPFIFEELGCMSVYLALRLLMIIRFGPFSYRQAETDCTSAIDIDPKIVKAYLRRGTAREMLGYYKDAVDDFSHALVLEPMNKTAGVAINRLKKLFP